MKFTRRQILLGAGTAAAGWFWNQNRSPEQFAPLPISKPQPNAPNILWILTDQERADLPNGLPLPGHEWLRSRGISFENHHVHTTPCSPSRGSLYTGVHSQIHGILANVGAPPFTHLQTNIPTIGHRLRAAGYYTAYKGKWHLSHIDSPGDLQYGPFPHTRDALAPYGFSDYNQDGDPHGSLWTGLKYDGQTAAQSVHWLHDQGKKLQDEKKPWFLAVNFVNPHDVMFYQATANQAKTRLHKDYMGSLGTDPPHAPYNKKWEFELPKNHQDDLKNKPWMQRDYVNFCQKMYGEIAADDGEAWRRYQNYYFNCIRDADQHLLTVLLGLESSGLLKNTMIIFSADHGEMAGAHGLRQKGPFAYQENTRVPLIFVHPEGQKAVKTQALSGGIDLVPTILAAAGAEKQQQDSMLKGVNLLNIIRGEKTQSERDSRGILFSYSTTLYMDTEFSLGFAKNSLNASPFGVLRRAWHEGNLLPSRENRAFFRGIRTGQHTFARYFAPADHHAPLDWKNLSARNDLEVYDHATDPYELKNIAYEPAHQALVLALNQQTQQLIAQEVGQDSGQEQQGPQFLYQT